jgi:hypothetical protein
MSFTMDDLSKMASAFNKLKDVLQVPLKLGHNDEQPVTDGQPALGWVTAMEVAGEKLVAVFEFVPDIVKKAFDKKLYRNVSVEMNFDVTHKGTPYDFVITAVALLGADIPAVNVLNDLGALMSRNSNLPRSGYAAGSQVYFSTITGNIKEEPIMTPEQIAAMQAENAKLKGDNAVLQADFTVLKTTSEVDKAAAEARFAKIEADQKKAQVDAKRIEFSAILEEAVKAKAITPVQRETYAKVLKLDNDDNVLTLEATDVKALFADAKGMPNKSTAAAGSDDDDDDDESPDQSLVAKAHEYMAKSGEKNFSRAIDVVMAGNPELARAYIEYNGEVRN